MSDLSSISPADQAGGPEHDDRVFYILTGLSGAGKSLVSEFMEDRGFYCVDNLPTELIETFVELTLESRKKHRQILLVCDVRADLNGERCK